MTAITIIIATLGAVGAGFVLFHLGRWYERNRLSALIDWALSLAQDLGASMSALEAAELQAGSLPEESEARVH